MSIAATETNDNDGLLMGSDLPAVGLRADVVVACSDAERFAALIASDRARRVVVVDRGLGHSAHLADLMPVLGIRAASADRLPEGSFCLRVPSGEAGVALALAVVLRVASEARQGRGVAPARVYADGAAFLAALPPGADDFPPVVVACEPAEVRRPHETWSAALPGADGGLVVLRAGDADRAAAEGAGRAVDAADGARPSPLILLAERHLPAPSMAALLTALSLVPLRHEVPAHALVGCAVGVAAGAAVSVALAAALRRASPRRSSVVEIVRSAVSALAASAAAAAVV